MTQTLVLGERKSAMSKVALAAVALALVGLAATAAVVGSTKVNAQSDVLVPIFNAKQGTVPNCDKDSKDFFASLPKWDPEYTGENSFYNSCYRAFRCCTTTGNGNGCYVSDEYGSKCRGCLKKNAPKTVKKVCTTYANDKKLEKSEVFNKAAILKDSGMPTPTSKYAKTKYNVDLNKIKAATGSCWSPPGEKDPKTIAFSEKCFEVLSWCNLLCPRDTANSEDHVMCKHCTLLGFGKDAPKTVYTKVKGDTTWGRYGA